MDRVWSNALSSAPPMIFKAARAKRFPLNTLKEDCLCTVGENGVDYNCQIVRMGILKMSAKLPMPGVVARCGVEVVDPE